MKHKRNTQNALSFRNEMSILQNCIFHVTLIEWVKTTVQLTVKIQFFLKWFQWSNSISDTLIHHGSQKRAEFIVMLP